MTQLTLGKLLNLPHFHHFYNLPIHQGQASTTYILVFESTHQPLFVDLESPNGSTAESRFATHFTQDSLLMGLGAIPLSACTSCQILEIKQNQARRGVSLFDLVEDFGHLPIFKAMTQSYHLRNRTSIYDPYRYAYTIEEKKANQEQALKVIPRKEYADIKDFHPFLQTSKGNVYAVPCYFQDQKRKQTVKIYVMGWYFYEKKLKISWKPSHSRKSRWRSSIVAVDKRTDRYFFQGELYKKGSFPIFLDALEPKHSSYQMRLDSEFKAFLSLIEEQKRKARLRIR